MDGKRPPPTPAQIGSSLNYLLIKLSSRCNFDCTYCYWFRDGSVRQLPAALTPEVAAALPAALERHIAKYRLSSFTCSFHGGEPTLYGPSRFKALLRALDEVGQRTHCDLRYAMTTNGSLLTPDWIRLIVDFEVSVTVSLDGPPDVHDARRITIKGRPTWREAVAGYLELCRAGINPSILAVCDPAANPRLLLDHFVRDLGARFCDVLVPDSNHDQPTVSIAGFYKGLFDHWYDNYSDDGVQVRILNDFMRGLLGLQTRTESVGLAPTQTVCLNTNGNIEPHDVLRIAGPEQVLTTCNILTHELDMIASDPKWLSVRSASTELSEVCLACRYKNACGGGHIAQRWSAGNGYNNPSVYCEDFKSILDHVAGRLAQDISLKEKADIVPSSTIADRIRSGVSLFSEGNAV